MKKISLLLAIAFAATSCNCQKGAVENDIAAKEAATSQEKLPTLEYTAYTRGFFQKVTIENQKVTVSADRNSKGETTPLSNANAKELLADFQKLKLNELATYKDPTQMRFYDGAAIANLKVTLNGKEYQTTDFDHGHPPVEIEKLVNKIVAFGKKE